MENQARDLKTAPLYKLSVDLIHTYKKINEYYYAKKRSRQHRSRQHGDGYQGSSDTGHTLSTSRHSLKSSQSTSRLCSNFNLNNQAFLIDLKNPIANCNHKNNYDYNASHDYLYTSNLENHNNLTNFNHVNSIKYNHNNNNNNKCDNNNCNNTKTRSHRHNNLYSSPSNTTISTLDNNYNSHLKLHQQQNQIILQHKQHHQQQQHSNQQQQLHNHQPIQQLKQPQQHKQLQRLKPPQQPEQQQQKKEQEYAQIEEGDVWDGRYVFANVLGKGSFGQVLRARDRVMNEEVAVKVIKNKKPFLNQARIEIHLLELIRANDPDKKSGVVHMHRYFMSESPSPDQLGHLCLVFELLSYNLYDLIRNTNFKGVSLNLTRKFAHQLCTALQFLSSKKLSIIHCDLKPENILLVNPRRSQIKIVDFGSSCKRSQRLYSYIQSRFYRCPEILLGLPYDLSIDVWSVGCILVEVHVGEPIFHGLDEADQLSKIIEVLGYPPEKMVEKCSKFKKFFTRNSSPHHHNSSPHHHHHPSTHAHSIFSSYSIRDAHKYKSPGSRKLRDVLGMGGGRKGEGMDYQTFHDLVLRMLTYDPCKRLTPSQSLHHPFFSPTIPQLPSTTPTIPTGSTFSLSNPLKTPKAPHHHLGKVSKNNFFSSVLLSPKKSHLQTTVLSPLANQKASFIFSRQLSTNKLFS